MEKIKKESLSEKDELKILITKKKNPLRETFGTFKFKRSIDEILKEGDRESWDEWYLIKSDEDFRNFDNIEFYERQDSSSEVGSVSYWG